MLNLKPKEFWDLSWPEFWEMYEGWQIRRQYELEHTRYLGTMMVNTSLGAPKTALKPRDLFPLPEIDPQATKVNEDEIEAFRQRMSARFGREIRFAKTTPE